MKADFLPADVKSELGRFERKKAAKQQQMGDSQVTQANTPFMPPAFDGAYLKNLSNEVERMKLNSERFATIFHDEFKMCLPKDQPKLEMLNIGEQSEIVKNKMSEWQQVRDIAVFFLLLLLIIFCASPHLEHRLIVETN